MKKNLRKESKEQKVVRLRTVLPAEWPPINPYKQCTINWVVWFDFYLEASLVFGSI